MGWSTFWGAEVRPGQGLCHVEAGEWGTSLHLSQATLGLDGDGKGRTVVKCKVPDEPEFLLCSLTPGVSESCSLDLLFDKDVTFSVTGSTSVHLVGYHIPAEDAGDDVVSGMPYYPSSQSSDEEVSLDSEYSDDFSDEDLLYEDFSPSTFATLEELDADGNPILTPRLMRLEDKQSSPKEESDKGRFVETKKRKATGSVKDKTNSSSKRGNKKVAVEASEDRQPGPKDESDEGQLVATKKGKSTASVKDKTNASSKRGNKQVIVEESEDEDGFPSSSMMKQAVNESEATPDPPTGSNQLKKEKKKKKNKKDKTPTQAEVESTPNKAASGNGNPETSLARTSAENGTSVRPPKDKIGKKASPAIRKFPNGLEIEEMAMGKPDARQTKSGKKVTLTYIGKFKSNGKVFDSNIGKKPFAFRLGVGDVVKGLDVGVAGMRIGDKRKITVPPAMGYGVKGLAGTIPGNSWLVFDVEVIDVAN